MCLSLRERQQAPPRGTILTLQLAGGLEIVPLYRAHIPRSLLCVVPLVIEGQEARRRQIRDGGFDHLPVAALQALFLVVTVFLAVVIHVGTVEIVRNFLDEGVVRCS